MSEDIILHGDVYSCIDYLEDNSIAVVITSPPYWKQRDYRFDGQIGQERTPEEYIGRLITVFNKLRQKLRKDGIFFLNIGDKYFNRYGKSHLLQIPYRLAYHMVQNGWHLEDIIIWHKPNHMPSSVKDRFTNTYEPVLVLAKSENNIYKKGISNIVEIPLQPTLWKHTAVYPEALVREMLNRVSLRDGDIVLDPFAGTGTTAVVVKKIRDNSKKIYSIMIEKSEEFIEIIKIRTNIKDVIQINDKPYFFNAIENYLLPNTEPYPILENKHGEVYIAEKPEEFLSILAGMTTKEFKEFHREDALYFFGVKNWDIQALYYPYVMLSYGYVLRNMIIVSEGESWFPVFMFANDTTKVAYKFYLDRVRVKPKTKEKRNWADNEFIGMKVADISGKKPRNGYIVEILDKYEDCFPKIVVVQWNGNASIEFVIHPEKDELLMEGVKYFCPKCGTELVDPYDPAGENICQVCGMNLWESIDTVPLIKEPEEILKSFRDLEVNEYSVGQVVNIKEFEKKKLPSTSKFSSLERINWGASPGARKTMLGEYFTKMRLYRIDQPIVAQYLTLLRKSKNMSIQDVINKLPEAYYHTVGHWFRKDFGGSIPIPDDVKLIRKIFGEQNGLLTILERTALKFQTVKTSIKGKNTGDYIHTKNIENLNHFLKSLYQK